MIPLPILIIINIKRAKNRFLEGCLNKYERIYTGRSQYIHRSRMAGNAYCDCKHTHVRFQQNYLCIKRDNIFDSGQKAFLSVYHLHLEIRFGSKNVRVEVTSVQETVKKEEAKEMYKDL